MAQDRGMGMARGSRIVSEAGNVLDGAAQVGAMPGGGAGELTAGRRAHRSGRFGSPSVRGRVGTWRRSCAAVVDRWTRRRPAQVVRLCRADGECGMATAEYAIVMIAAVGFAALLIAILSSSEIREVLTGLVRGALTV